MPRNVALTDKTDDGLINATDPNLKSFFARGGKLIQYHGGSDQRISLLTVSIIILQERRKATWRSRQREHFIPPLHGNHRGDDRSLS